MSDDMEILKTVLSFLDSGGGVLWLIFMVSISLWTLICERLLYFKFAFPELQKRCLDEWLKNNYSDSHIALHMKRCILSEAQISMQQFESTIKLLIAICPMLGLLGTVIGMIQVFDVMAVIGTSNARSMAAGISQATISTMAGMVVAISGLYFHKLIEKTIQEKSHQLAQLLN
ncbi:MAG: MotA/TolQ/ExbB proton channel family protein [Methyloprofundus sp.]|nr:MotA/TolQ/ExbB proton channel family protein [Methyloprofundus sp.]